MINEYLSNITIIGNCKYSNIIIIGNCILGPVIIKILLLLLRILVAITYCDNLRLFMIKVVDSWIICVVQYFIVNL